MAKQASLPLALLQAGDEICQSSPTGRDQAYLHGVFCQLGLPRARVTESTWATKCGNCWITLTAGPLSEPGKGNQKPVYQPLPYGAMPRLILAWLSAVALRTESREIDIGGSANAFLGMLGLDGQGRHYRSLREQMHSLAATYVHWGYNGKNYDGKTIESFDTWLAPGADHPAVWPGKLELRESYYREILESAVPLDNRALGALRGSALALDIYAFLAQRLHRINRGTTTLRWHHVRDQFGQDYAQTKTGAKNFKRSFLPALKKALVVYPQAKVAPVSGGIRLIASPPPVPYKGGPTR